MLMVTGLDGCAYVFQDIPAQSLNGETQVKLTLEPTATVKFPGPFSGLSFGVSSKRLHGNSSSNINQSINQFIVTLSVIHVQTTGIIQYYNTGHLTVHYYYIQI